MTLAFTVEDPRADEVRTLLAAHLDLARSATPACLVHALDVDGLLDPAVTLFGARRDGVLLGIGALRRLAPSHAELKSMHVGEAGRRQGVGRALLEHLLAVAAARGCERVSLETGTAAAFAPARRLYESADFVRCEPFGEYTDTPGSVCMTLVIGNRR